MIETLWPHVVLRDYPNHEAAWGTIERLPEENRAAVHQVVGSNVHFSFQEQLTDLEKKLVANPIVALRGHSGTGKSSLVATFVGQPGRYSAAKTPTGCKGVNEILEFVHANPCVDVHQDGT